MENRNRRSFIAILIAVFVAGGLAFAGSQGGEKAFGFPIFALCVGTAFLIQWIAFIPAYIKQTEAFYDLTGSITFITVLLVAVSLSPTVDLRGRILFGIISVWALRLGTFLFRRIRAAGEDRRFREIKKSFGRFLLAWTLQGLWISFSLAAALAAITSVEKINVGTFAWAGLFVWVLGFGIEVTADRQKSAFNAKPENKGKFVNIGLWSWSRHPNYFGEIVLWIGVAIIALPNLSGWQYMTLISPIFIILLLTRISGIPMLEERADEKWGGQAEYEAYKQNTPVLIPMAPKKRG